MFKKILLSAAMLVSFAGCAVEPAAYNSNSGNDGSRDSASQLIIDTTKVDNINAEIRDNEDWMYFIPKDEGFVTVKTFFDSPSGLTGSVNVYDGFGRTLQTITLNKAQSLHEFDKIEVKSNDRYFVAIKVDEGISDYSIVASFEFPPPPVIEEEVVDDSAAAKTTTTTKSKCVPADKCKTGQNCCKPKAAASSSDEIAAGATVVRGKITLVTPREGEICDVKIDGLGSNKGIKPGMKAVLRGLNRKVDIYKCLKTSCNASIKATSEELARYDAVDVAVD